MLPKSVFSCFDERGGYGGNSEIVDMSEKNGVERPFFSLKEYGVVVLGSGQSNVGENFPKDLVPTPSALPESVKCL